MSAASARPPFSPHGRAETKIGRARGHSVLQRWSSALFLSCETLLHMQQSFVQTFAGEISGPASRDQWQEPKYQGLVELGPPINECHPA